MINFRKVSFFRCIGLQKDLESLKLHPKITRTGAIVGSSNVGKSSLLNHFFQNNKLAKVSSTPGKTQTLNYFLVDDQLMVIDLPGYGFAKRSKTVKEQWHDLIESYFAIQRPHFILILLDIRTPPSEEDLQMIKWAHHLHIEVHLIYTKCDKIAKTKLKSAELKLSKMIEDETNLSNLSPICYSIKDKNCRGQLAKVMNG